MSSLKENTNMKIIILFLALVSAAFAQYTKVGGAGTSQVGGAGTSKVSAYTPPVLGTNTIGASNNIENADGGMAYRVQASSSGTLQNAFFYFANYNGGSAVKVCVYGPSTNTTPLTDSTAPLIGKSVSLAYSSNAWVSGAMDGGTIVSGSFYWVVIYVSSAQGVKWVYPSSGATTSFDGSAAGSYTTPDATIHGFGGSAANGPISCYITVL